MSPKTPNSPNRSCQEPASTVKKHEQFADAISYKNGVIYIKMELLELKIKGQRVIIGFNILLLENNKAVLKMP